MCISLKTEICQFVHIIIHIILLLLLGLRHIQPSICEDSQNKWVPRPLNSELAYTE